MDPIDRIRRLLRPGNGDRGTPPDAPRATDDTAAPDTPEASGEIVAGDEAAASLDPDAVAPPATADPERFATHAAALVEERSDSALDYTPDSLADLDALVTAGAVDADETTATRLGAYFGETVVRARDGAWTTDDADRWRVELDHDVGRLGVRPFRTAVDVLRGEETFVAAHERLAGDDPFDDPAVAETSAEQAEALAATWPGYDLDYTVDSLARLDDLVDEEFGGFAGRETVTEDLAAAATPFGLYFGEVVRRTERAAWAEGPEIVVATAGGDGAAVDVVQAAVSVLVGNDRFVVVYDRLIAERDGD